MSLEQLNNIFSIIASFGVFVTLAFVAVQLRNTSRTDRMIAAQINTQILLENFGRVIESADLADLLTGGKTQDQITPADRLRISNFFAASFRHYEMLHTHKRHGLHEEEMWQASEARLEISIERAIIRGWWAESRRYYTKSFAAYVDGRIADWVAQNPNNTEDSFINWQDR